jgi:hypothetical protein
MKKVLLEKSNEITINSLNDQSIVGVKWLSDGEKAWVTKSIDGFIIVGVGDKNIENCYKSESLRELIKLCCGSNNSEVFVFETRGELINWLKDYLAFK